MPKTTLLYLSDSTITSAKAMIVDILPLENDQSGVILDKTIFYVQGGGQPSDQGKIFSVNADVNITNVKKTDQGILHIGLFSGGVFEKGETVTMELNTARRTNNTRLHSAGHLIDAAVYALGLSQLTPTKGFHFPDGPYDEFDGIIEDTEGMAEKIEGVCKQLIQEERPAVIREIPVGDVEKECGYVPPYIPKKGTVRVNQIYGFPAIPCGGTHVANTKEIRDITIRKVKSRAGKTRIAHSIPLD